MANTYLIDASKDAALNYLDTNVTQLFITSALCATYAEASNTYKLGVKASPSVSAATDDGTTGRKITISAITDGTVSASGDATHVALCSADTLLAAYPLNALVAVTSGSTFTLTEHDINLPDPA
jgi:hypothetical protein